MKPDIKLRMTPADLTKAAALLDGRGQTKRIPRDLLSKLVCDYGTLFDHLAENHQTIGERVDA